MLPIAAVVALAALTFQPVAPETTAQAAHVFVRDSAAPAQSDPAGGPVHDAGIRPFTPNDPPNAQLTNAHGGGLNVSIAEWRAASGTAEIAPATNGLRVRIACRGLIPMGRYSVFVRQLAGRAGVVLTPVDITGAADTFFADANGVGGIVIETPNAIPSGAQLVLIYHSDGADHQSSPGELGVTAHEQLITRVP